MSVVEVAVVVVVVVEGEKVGDSFGGGLVVEVAVVLGKGEHSIQGPSAPMQGYIYSPCAPLQFPGTVTYRPVQSSPVPTVPLLKYFPTVEPDNNALVDLLLPISAS